MRTCLKFRIFFRPVPLLVSGDLAQAHYVCAIDNKHKSGKIAKPDKLSDGKQSLQAQNIYYRKNLIFISFVKGLDP